MASVTITFTDTPDKTVSVKTDAVPAVGKPLTPAQAAGMDAYIRACHQWGLTADRLAKRLDAAAVQIANYGTTAENNRRQCHGDHAANPTL